MTAWCKHLRCLCVSRGQDRDDGPLATGLPACAAAAHACAPLHPACVCAAQLTAPPEPQLTHTHNSNHTSPAPTPQCAALCTQVGLLMEMVLNAARAADAVEGWAEERETKLTEELDAHLRAHRPVPGGSRRTRGWRARWAWWRSGGAWRVTSERRARTCTHRR